jgi:hypothetical protein
MSSYPSSHTDAPYHIEIDYQIPSQGKHTAAYPVFLAGHAQSADACARAEHIIPPQPAGIDAAVIVIDWRDPELTIILDGLYLKNVIIRNAPVEFLGSGLKLENVLFVNCSFKMNFGDATTSALVLAILDRPGPVTFPPI